MQVITTRSYDERLQTLENVRKAGISVCCGGIIGLGEEKEDRMKLLHTLATLPEHPESVPVNALVAVKGTPLEDRPPVDALDMVRMIATARCIMPRCVLFFYLSRWCESCGSWRRFSVVVAPAHSVTDMFVQYGGMLRFSCSLIAEPADAVRL